MIVAVEKYDVMSHLPIEAGSELRWAQVACLYWRFHKDVAEIAKITGYCTGTVKSYVRKYQELEKYYDDYFNFDAPKKTKQVRKPLAVFDDGYNIPEVLDCSGIYLVGSTYIDPYTKKIYYWIKVGMSSTSLAKRLRGYRSENPMVWIADVMYVDTDNVGAMEHECHIALSDIAYGIARNTDEWFIVDEDTYFEICEKGFHYFFEYED